jgi:hypothetical protein
MNSGADLADSAKINQLQQKLMSTAVMEIALLNDFHRSVKSVMTAALSSGASRISQGNREFITGK